MIPLLDRYRGALLGVLAGDALGAPYEIWDSDKIRRDYSVRGGLVPFDYPDPWNKDGSFPAGRPTDDSELTAALAESLIECGGMDHEDQYQRFKLAAVDGVSFLWDGPAKGFGGTTKKALAASSFVESLKLLDVPRIPSNGSLMRSAPIALMFHGLPSALTQAACQSSLVTHRHETALACCVIFVHLLDKILSGFTPEEAWKRESERIAQHSHLASLFPYELTEPVIPPKWPHRGAADLTLLVAIWSLLHAKSFRDGIEDVVALGGDTDTYAAVAGALLGAHFGVESIPEDWRSVLKGGDRMLVLANRLYLAHLQK